MIKQVYFHRFYGPGWPSLDELKPGMTATKEELIAWCRDHMAHYKAPRTIVIAEVPKTSTGKIQKFRLREMAKELG